MKTSDRLIAALGGDSAGARRVARQLVEVARAAEGHRLAPTRRTATGEEKDPRFTLPHPFKQVEDIEAWSLGASVILCNYLESLAIIHAALVPKTTTNAPTERPTGDPQETNPQ
jgi:hypothetical protein